MRNPSTGAEHTSLVIRGVFPLYGNPVGIYMDDVPIPISRAGTYLLSYPTTFDLERVEILRGPQSVLLGDHAVSGAFTGRFN
jgi:iron complex outermembrane recepter protein